MAILPDLLLIDSKTNLSTRPTTTHSVPIIVKARTVTTNFSPVYEHTCGGIIKCSTITIFSIPRIQYNNYISRTPFFLSFMFYIVLPKVQVAGYYHSKHPSPTAINHFQKSTSSDEATYKKDPVLELVDRYIVELPQ